MVSATDSGTAGRVFHKRLDVRYWRCSCDGCKCTASLPAYDTESSRPIHLWADAPSGSTALPNAVHPAACESRAFLGTLVDGSNVDEYTLIYLDERQLKKD